MFHNPMLRGLLAAALVASALTVQAETITMAMVTVGDPGNAADPATGNLYGAVGYTYQMGKYDVTTSQYAAFLNAAAQTSDPYGLYNSSMATNLPTVGIAQSGSPGSYSYSVTGTAAGKNNMPVFDVTWLDAARFCNWLENGQPSGAGITEGPGTTETGAYTLNGAINWSQLMLITRNTGATYFIPSENEWYKSAYYKGGSTNAGYWLYPTQSNTAPINTLSSSGTNNANFNDEFGTGFTDPTNYLTPVGFFAGSPGPYGTYDQGGNVWQWNEAKIGDSTRGSRGGSCAYDPSYMASSYESYPYYPIYQNGDIGFRVASTAGSPEPGTVAMLLAGALAFGIWRLRRNA